MNKRISVFLAAITFIAMLTACSGGAPSRQDAAAEASEPSPVLSAVESDAEPEGSDVEHEASKEAEETTAEEYYSLLTLNSTALAQNTTGENPQKMIGVLLPPSYYTETEKRYPVVYYLHGFGENANDFVSMQKDILKRVFENGAKEFIFVGVDGGNVLGGSFYANSPVIGGWEDYVANEVVSLVDESFRTIASSDSRGICGFSMGGTGAVNISLRHPDVFGALFAMSPGLLADGDIGTLMETWKYSRRYLVSYAAAFSPNADDTENYGHIPELTGTDEDNRIVRDWESGFGNIGEKLDNYLALGKPLKAIKIIHGKYETYPWITTGCLFLSESLNERDIEHFIEETEVGHAIPPDVAERYLVPFFGENLAG